MISAHRESEFRWAGRTPVPSASPSPSRSPSPSPSPSPQPDGGGGGGSTTPPVTAKPKLAAVTGVTAQVATGCRMCAYGHIFLSWIAVPGADDYEIYRVGRVEKIPDAWISSLGSTRVRISHQELEPLTGTW